MSKRVLKALFAAVTISVGSLGFVAPAQAQSLDSVIAACAVEGAVEADCLAAVAAYIAALPPGVDLNAALADLAVALAEAGAPVSATPVLVAALNAIAAVATDSTVAADILELAAVVDERDGTGAVSETNV